MLTYEFKKGNGNYTNIKTSYGVNVESSAGLIGRPSLKNVSSIDWQYLNGITPDLASRRYNERKIELNCWITANTKQGLIDRLNNLQKFFMYDELIFMRVTFDNNDGQGALSNNKGLFFMVYLDSISEPVFKWRYGRQLAKITIRLVEPCPVKRIKQLTITSGDSKATVIYDIKSNTDIDIYTSNGTTIMGVTEGRGIFSLGNKDYVILAGDIEHAERLGLNTADSENTFEEIYAEI